MHTSQRTAARIPSTEPGRHGIVDATAKATAKARNEVERDGERRIEKEREVLPRRLKK
jgi:hypothetical protein